MSQVCSQRLKKELADMETVDPILKDEIQVQMKEHSMTDLIGTIKGPPGTPYEGGRFKVTIKIPVTYPFDPPAVRFTTKVWHPNISSASGCICLDVLSHNWSSAMTIKSTLLSLQSLLQNPVPSDPIDAVVARTMKRSHKKYNQIAKYWTQSFATEDGSISADLQQLEAKVDLTVNRSGNSREAVIVDLSNKGFPGVRGLSPVVEKRSGRKRGGPSTS